MNDSIFYFFYSIAHVSPFLDTVVIFVAKYYGFLILAALLIYLFEHKDKKEGARDLLVVLATAGSAWFVAHFFKDIFQTLRPFDALSWVKPLVPESGYAFPSGHATFFMALASSLWFYHKRLAVFFGFSALLIGIARVTAGIHWPMDILGGLLLGFLIGIAVFYIFGYILQKAKKSLY